MTPSQTSRSKLQPSRWQFDAIGTRWVIETPEPLGVTIQLKINDCIEQFDRIYSRFRDDSVVARIAQQAGTFKLSNESSEMSCLYKKLYDATDGALTPLVGKSLVAAGYDKDYSFKPTGTVTSPRWEDVLEWSKTTVKTSEPVMIDIGAAGKGKLVDMIGSILEAHDIRSYVIDASGDVRHRGSDVQSIGLEDPNDASRIIGIMRLANASLCASAVNRRRWGKGWHHVIDARTGVPVDNIIATWVVAESTMEADGLATALFFADSDRLKSVADFQFVRLFGDGHIEHSHDFVGQLFV